MKYPEYRLSMEAALPSSVHSWLKLELEQRGIDSHVYTRYIIHLLLQNEDLDCDTDLYCFSNTAGRKKGKKLGRKQLSISDEERKKCAAVECLTDVSEEKSDIISLIDELCLRLKDSEAQATVSPVIKSNSSGSESNEDSGSENQNSTERYYAAFPSLHGQSSPTSASSSVAVESVWKNNPLVKPHPGTSPEDSSSSNDDLEVKKINKASTVIIPKHRKIRKNRSRNKKEYSEHRKSKSNYQKSKLSSGNQYKSESSVSDTAIQNWPPGFARLDPLVQYDTFGEEICEFRIETPKRPNEEMCTKVECILKGMLLPTPEKTYKDLEDVDTEVIEVKREKSHTTTCNRVDIDNMEKKQINIEDTEKATDVEPVEREASVSPELQEQEIWYTQPIGAILLSPEEEKGCSKLRLYKRNSYPLFSPQGSDGQAPAVDCAADSSASSPVFDRSRSSSASSTDSDNILEGFVFMPTWLTEEISADPEEDTSCDVQSVALSTSFHSSSPFFENQEAVSVFSKSLESTLTSDEAGWGEAAFSFPPSLASSENMALETDLYNPWSINSDENLTPTPDEAEALKIDQCDFGGQLSVSLVDWNYLSNFSNESEMPAFYLEDSSLRRSSLQRTCLSSLSQSQLVFDFSLDVPDYTSPQFGMFGFCWWQTLWNEENGFSQLWDVNMQKRSKVSPMGCQSFLSVSQVWLAENTFVFYNNSLTDKDSTDGQEENENTLIPRISIDLMAESSVDSIQYSDKSEDGIENLRANFSRSVSVVDVPAVWDETMDIRGPDPKLSKSFELVPSETSAFCDVSRKLVHVHSEPNLAMYRQEFSEGHKSRQQSPQEHLYFSPKTHFRPITPAFAPELSQSKAKQQICHDLFGGLPTTKTPYQQYLTKEEGGDEDYFIPKFKLKNSCKSIQTGDEEERSDSPAQSCDSADRDTPQTLTLGLIEEIMGTKDDADLLFPISEDLDTANTDSAYETDYGLSAMESEQDDNSKPLHFNCTNRVKEDSYDGSLTMSSSVDHGNLGDRMNYSLDSFMATFPHTQDWPDISQSCQFSSRPANWSDTEGQYHMASSWPAPDVLQRRPEEVEQLQDGPDDVFLMDSYHDSWLASMFSDHHSDCTDTDKYKQVWTTGDEDTDPSSTLEAYHFDFSNYHREFDTHLVCGESSPQAVFPNDGLDFPCSDCIGHQREALTEGQSEGDTDVAVRCHADGSAGECVHHSVGPRGDEDWTNPGEYFSVKLVYKDKQDQDSTSNQKSYGSFDLMPMPGEAVLSSELEEKWMDRKAFLYKPSCMQRKPCSFYLEGNCRRTDCKFAHDISNITCRFWEEGDCFKGPLCPFLHGYPRMTSPSTKQDLSETEVKDNLNLNNNEEFPELTLTVKNGNSASKKVVKPVKGVTASKRDRSRKSSARRHSNKENKAESRFIDKCSTSV